MSHRRIPSTAVCAILAAAALVVAARASQQPAKVNAHEIGPGVVYKDANVTVTAFATKHAMESFGYRFDTADRTIVISGDPNPAQATIDACRGCDVLIHEAGSSGGSPPCALPVLPVRFRVPPAVAVLTIGFE